MRVESQDLTEWETLLLKEVKVVLEEMAQDLKGQRAPAVNDLSLPFLIHLPMQTNGDEGLTQPTQSLTQGMKNQTIFPLSNHDISLFQTKPFPSLPTEYAQVYVNPMG